MPIVDEVTLFDKIPIGMPTAIEVASVGDVVELEGEMYIVDVVGFMKLVEIEDTPGFFEITDIKES